MAPAGVGQGAAFARTAQADGSALRDAHRRDQLEAAHREKDAKVEAWWAKQLETYDADHNGTFDREELRACLTTLYRSEMGADKPEVTDAQIKRSFKQDKGDEGWGKDEVLAGAKKFKSQVKFEKKIDEMFKKADTDGNGSLDKSQLPAFLKANSPEYAPTDHDVEFVLSKCDHDGSGTLTFDELAPAISVWMDCVERQVHIDAGGKEVAAKKSAACAIL